MSKQTTTGDVILSLRIRVLEAYEQANSDKTTRPGAFGMGAHMIQQEMDCDFRVACMLMDCWVVEHTHSKPPPPT